MKSKLKKIEAHFYIVGKPSMSRVQWRAFHIL
jgi:hypothetical protein